MKTTSRGTMKFSSRVAALPDHVQLGQLGAFVEEDVRPHGLTEQLVRDSHDGRLPDPRDVMERVLDLDRAAPSRRAS